MAQGEYWDGLHRVGVMDKYRDVPSEFVRAVAEKLEPRSEILELGCGTGGDAKYLSDWGHIVVATDVSDSVIAANREAIPEVGFMRLDTEQPFMFDDEMFDVVFANLSLHYSDNSHTRATIAEIWRVLRRGGKLIFRCKSIHSVDEKRDAEEVSPNIYVKNEHLRHLFSTEYVESLLEDRFCVIRNQYTTGDAYGYESYFVECEAQKR